MCVCVCVYCLMWTTRILTPWDWIPQCHYKAWISALQNWPPSEPKAPIPHYHHAWCHKPQRCSTGPCEFPSHDYWHVRAEQDPWIQVSRFTLPRISFTLRYETVAHESQLAVPVSPSCLLGCSFVGHVWQWCIRVLVVITSIQYLVDLRMHDFDFLDVCF